MNLNQEISKLLEKEGCKIFGFADLSILPKEPRKGFDIGIVMGAIYTTEGMRENLDGNIQKFGSDSWATCEHLERFQKTVIKFIKENGYKANTKYVTTAITYKMLGTLAGLGWIGKCAVLTTKKYGPALRLTSVLTNAPLECGTPITKSLCPESCTACADICHVNAIKGGLWEQGIHRDTFFDAKACRRGRRERDSKNTGEPTCGLCISACPLTKKGLGYK